MTGYPKLSIKKGREWHILRGHPWLFSGGISQAPKKVEPGAIVTLLDCDGKFIANGYYNANCDIAVRILSRTANQPIDRTFMIERISAAWNLRKLAFNFEQTNIFRLINAEGDFLPGFIADYYGGVLVVQSHTAGADTLLELFLQALDEVVQPRAIVLRNDAAVRQREGLNVEAPRIIKGSLDGEIMVKENSLNFLVDPIRGQKTGFFTDQRDKRAALAAYTAHLPYGASLLNCFSYTCSFSVYAVARNLRLSTTNVDQSQPALDQGVKNFELNSLALDSHEFINADAFTFLEKQILLGTKYDAAVLDPPAFAKSHKDKPRALKAYSRMAALGIQIVKDGAILVLCSCSGAISLDEFVECVRQSAGASGRAVQLLDTFQQGADHPVNLLATEASYLKVVFCRVLD